MSFTDKDSSTDIGDWQQLWEEFRCRSKKIPSSIPILVFALVAIIGAGGIGIWVELFESGLNQKKELLTLIYTYFAALTGTTACQIILRANSNKVCTSIGILTLGFAIGGVFLVLKYRSTNLNEMLCVAVVFAIISIIIWALANIDSIEFTTPDEASVGGDKNKKLKGNIDEFS